ncbi:L-threonylcarbamoyladenylate synthase [Senegalia massiliensis]|uniref:Threonylcarbamoyl-AMP synthase n=1 Tax=Senegalia massiliensis TaxID=1720316 RepID=A0A845QVM6_9CLOT|nr:L-threonylcarbamoyladenylate synthase [Senegalia massiliensis]NBI06054.1 threonylcarbamoyl-AMP synthase [Senegalia massiliensis]
MNKKTIIKKSDEENALELAASILRNGGLVVIPTETVYGLGANALNTEAVKKIFKAKGRPQDNPLIVHISNINQLNYLVRDITDSAKLAIEKFWPGPLTLIMKKKDIIPDIITGGLDTVAIRMPKNNIARKIIELADIPVAAPSANISGRPSPTYINHVKEDLFGKVDMIIDGGKTDVGLESTVLDVTGKTPMILRPGDVTREDLLEVFDEVEQDKSLKDKDIVPKSPGQKYKHYSPKANMKIIRGDLEKIIKRINILDRYYGEEGLKVGILATEETKGRYENKNLFVLGSRRDPSTIASNLFLMLREFDKLDVDIIIAEAIEEKGIGSAIMNRMEKAAGYNIENV